MRTVALDLGVRKISFCEVQDGRVVERATVRELSALDRFIGPNSKPARIAFEACREAWHLHEQLSAWGHEPVVVDTTRVKQLGIGQHGRKTDRIDAETLARGLERNLLPRAHVLSKPRQVLRLELSVRRALVETRAQYATTIRGLVRANGDKLRSCETEKLVEVVEGTALGERTRAVIGPLLPILRELNKQIGEVERKLEVEAAKEPVIELLTSAPGVAEVVAAAFVSVVDDAARFKHAHQVQSYLGLVPTEKTSTKRRLGSITKQGNAYLRSLLTQAAWGVLRQKNADDPLRRWGEHIASRRGKRVAVIAVARRLVGVLWAMWRDGTRYDAKHVGEASAEGLERQAAQIVVEAKEVRRAGRKAS